MAVDILEAESETLTLAGAVLTPDVSGALWWARERALIVSDLHLEKGSSFAARGVALPPYDTRATLEALRSTIERFRPARVIALGDSFHDADGDARMDEIDRSLLRRLVRSVESWIWITGNHDPAPPSHFGGVVAPEFRIGGVTFRHEPSGRPGEIAGHLHPCARVTGLGRTLRRPCFAADAKRLVMPAFGAYTGGLNVCDPAFDAAFPDTAPIVYVLGRDRVWPVDASSLRPD